ncbi:hypothetical protein [Francisella philomiragia]|uniref:hypothetical protein n=1 Tax=Francisella philomiragia TaxID=28110 RepID=UPI001905608A|nr:hypothetical protein [Francisella philomiragia]MBK2105437.1 hypothetical protein [Francisella philomiragia]
MRIFIYTPSYDENVGGIIVLHYLCHLLNELGADSRLIFMGHSGASMTNNSWNTPLAYKSDVCEDDIVIYPEIVAGNPLSAKKVFRWILYYPGGHTNNIEYDKHDILIKYRDVFITNDIQSYNMARTTLYISYLMDDIYKQTNFGIRTGSCYMVRKHKGQTSMHDSDSICLDGYSHTEIAKIFNEKKYFITYDQQTAYSCYAAMCGCIPVIVPSDNLSKKEWAKSSRYGQAYGFDDIQYALDTRDMLMQKVNESKKISNENVKNFIAELQADFGYILTYDKVSASEQNKVIQLYEKDTQIQERDTQIQERDTQIQERDTQILYLTEELDSYKAEINRIYNSLGWKLMKPFRVVMRILRSFNLNSDSRKNF